MSLGVPHPKPAPKAKSNKARGSRFERRVASRLGGTRMVLSGAVGGGDIVLPGWSVECKKRIKLPALIKNAMSQAEQDISIGDSRRPLVVIGEDRTEPYAVLYLKDLVRILEESGPENSAKIRDAARKAKGFLTEIEGLV